MNALPEMQPPAKSTGIAAENALDTPLQHSELPFSLAKFLSWISLVLILASSLMMAVFIGNTARNTLLVRQQNYSLLLAQNLNHQIYRRFTLPTVLTFGRVALRQSIQYELLDEVIRSTIHSLHVETLRIYGRDNVVNYSLFNGDVGRDNLIPQAAIRASESKETIFETLSDMSWPEAMFTLNLPARSFILRTSFPLRVDVPPATEGAESEALITGILELTQDITADYNTVIRFQWLIIATCLGSAFILFGLLQFFIIHAERILTERMARTRKLETDLHQSEKLASMGRVIASIAHEIRNPLGIIRSSAELLLRRTSETDVANRKMLLAVYDESCRLSQTVNDFLDYARPRAPKADTVDMAQVLHQALCFLDNEFTRTGVTVKQHVEGSLHIKGDKDLLYRAVYNVISNALQAMGSMDSTRPHILHIAGQETNDGNVTLSFADTGPGFSPEAYAKVLDPFFTTKDHGTGLGLPIVNTIIDSHGGQLTLGNNDSGGAFVRMSFTACTL